MSRILLALCLGLVVLALVAGPLGTLAYGADAMRDGELEIDGVRQPVALTWDEAGVPTVEASSLSDLAIGLGYAHAADHAWAMTLWRQAAQGGLGAWFGSDVRPLDRHARALGFDALAMETYRELDSETRGMLDAYAMGVNAALGQSGVAQGDAFVIMDVEPDAWAPWDALLVERLLAYLATPAPAADSTWALAARQDSSLIPFLRADSSFRATLGIGGTDQARAFLAPSKEGQAFIVNQPAGTSALPLFAPVTLNLDGRAVATSTLPGTLTAPIGWDGSRGWSVFLTSSMRLESLVGPPPPVVHSRIVERDGDEVLVEIPRDADGLALSVVVPQSDTLADATSGWRVRWTGFRPGTDVPAFIALLQHTDLPRFALMRGDGLRVDGDTTTVLGAPPVSTVGANAVFVGAAPASRQAGDVLIRLHARGDSATVPLPASVLASSDISLWAAERLPPLLRALGDRSSLDPLLDTPYSILKGWNYRYDPEAIAPTVFETWLDSHQSYTGHSPNPQDSLDVLLLPHTLRIARASLRDRYGTELIDWRWSRFQGGFHFPFERSLEGGGGSRRFNAPEFGTGGHPTVLFPGPDRPLDARPGTGSGPATWSAWAISGQPTLAVRSPQARLASSTLGFAHSDRDDATIFLIGKAPSSERPRLTLVSPS